jgi:hypothetical protein
MKEEKRIHIAMINSFNVLLGKATYEDVANSDIPYFTFQPDWMKDSSFVKMINQYFESKEMYEYCNELHHLIELFEIEENELECSCKYPIINIYSDSVRCEICNKYMNG